MTTDYAKKYEGFDLKFVDPASVNDPEECHWIMFELDHVVGDIEQQIEFSDLSISEGKPKNDPAWAIGARRALKSAKATRQAVQSRSAFLKNARRSEAQERIERVFMNTTIEVVPTDMLSRIWDAVHVKYPDLRR